MLPFLGLAGEPAYGAPSLPPWREEPNHVRKDRQHQVRAQ